MASGTNYLQEEYGQAEQAYQDGDFDRAAQIIDRLAEEFVDNPNILLLRGHIYCAGFQDYNLARQQYEAVLDLSSEPELLDCAHSGIEQVQELQQQLEESDAEGLIGFGGFEEDQDLVDVDSEQYAESESNQFENGVSESFGEDGFDQFADSEYQEFEDPFSDNNFDEQVEDLEEEAEFADSSEIAVEQQSIHEAGTFMVEDENEINLTGESEADVAEEIESPDLDELGTFVASEEEIESLEYSSDIFEPERVFESNIAEEDHFESAEESFADSKAEFEDYYGIDDSEYQENFNADQDFEVDTVLTEPHAIDNSEGFDFGESVEHNGLDYQDELEFDEIDSSFFDLEELEQGLPDTGLFNVADDLNEEESNLQNNQEFSAIGIDESESSSFLADSIDNSVIPTGAETNPIVEVEQGFFGTFANATMPKKQLITACCTSLVSAIAVFGASLGASVLFAPETEAEQSPRIQMVDVGRSGIMALVAGVASFGAASLFGSMLNKQIKQATENLQSQFDDVYQGNLNAKATVYSQDEFGRLATGFNRMTRVILTTTQEAQRRAEETEQAKEDLQRQVIRLLDDVEGAARGDLTVQATVTADVLGAVADAFNLTIQSLREIVRQVKEAAEQVNRSSTDSELFARNQSSEALRMAEELAVTLNSVQMMTESIERVAENAREAEEVARSSSVTALKGGKAVESTVAGIFQIRETVSETTRKVKRLAEASQEISKIVLIITQIAERTNQLALNASIQAAKAGEAGRGFAVVADEVRQLADRSGKSLKEIEQIVLQIQNETGSVMTAMEEGLQEVIDVTSRADQAKTALEDIIQVSNRIDTLVRSITADTVEQRENSRAVAQVMQSVELTAQATSQESQRVAGSLQSLVSIARDLLSSVERFRIDSNEE